MFQMQEGLTAPSEVEETREKLSKNEEKVYSIVLIYLFIFTYLFLIYLFLRNCYNAFIFT